MASFTDETIAVADVYAGGFLRAAKETERQDEVVAEFANFIKYMDEHPAFDHFLTSPTIDGDERRASLEKLFRGKLSEPLLNLLLVLNDRSRLEIVREVFAAIHARVEAERHQRRILVETAMPLPHDLKTRIKDVMSRRLGKAALLDERVSPELIGGMVIHVGDERFDASLAFRVRSMRQRLADRASREIQKGDGKYVTEG